MPGLYWTTVRSALLADVHLQISRDGLSVTVVDGIKASQPFPLSTFYLHFFSPLLIYRGKKITNSTAHTGPTPVIRGQGECKGWLHGCMSKLGCPCNVLVRTTSAKQRQSWRRGGLRGGNRMDIPKLGCSCDAPGGSTSATRRGVNTKVGMPSFGCTCKAPVGQNSAIQGQGYRRSGP